METVPNTSLLTELQVYKHLESSLLRLYRGRWAVINGEDCSVWHCYEDAIQYGYRTYGLNPFLCKQIIGSSVKVICPCCHTAEEYMLLNGK